MSSTRVRALTGDTILQLDDNGISPVAYGDTDLVQSWRSFLNRPDAYLRHLG